MELIDLTNAKINVIDLEKLNNLSYLLKDGVILYYNKETLKNNHADYLITFHKNNLFGFTNSDVQTAIDSTKKINMHNSWFEEETNFLNTSNRILGISLLSSIAGLMTAYFTDSDMLYGSLLGLNFGAIAGILNCQHKLLTGGKAQKKLNNENVLTPDLGSKVLENYNALNSN